MKRNSLKLIIVFIASLLGFFLIITNETKSAHAAIDPKKTTFDTRTKQDYDKIFPNPFASGCDFNIKIDSENKYLNNPPTIKVTPANSEGFGTDPKYNSNHPDVPPGWDPSTWTFILVESVEARNYAPLPNDNYYYFQCVNGNCERMAIQVNAGGTAEELSGFAKILKNFGPWSWVPIPQGQILGNGDNIYPIWRPDSKTSWVDIANVDKTTFREHYLINSNFCGDDRNIKEFLEWAQLPGSNSAPGKGSISGTASINPDRVKSIAHNQGFVERQINAGIRKILDIISGALDSVGQWLMKELLVIDLRSNPSTAAAISLAWGKVRNLSNILLILGLLFIAVANAIRFQIDYYTAKMLLPRLIIAAIFINFSHLMTMAILDVANVLTYQISHDIDFLALIVPQTMLSANAAGAGASLSFFVIAIVGAIGGASLAITFLSIFALTVVGVAIATLIIMLIVRMVVIYLLVVFSPLVFLFSVLPFTRDLTSTWWNYLARWVFMGPVIALILFVASQL